MQIICKNLFKNGVQNVHYCTETCLETLSSLINCKVDNDLSEIGPFCN